MTTYKRIEAVRKAGEILKFLARVKEPAGGTEIAAAVGLPAGTVMCSLATLEDLGFVQGVGDRYRLGLGLALIYARVKSGLEAERVRLEDTIKKLDNGGE